MAMTPPNQGLISNNKGSSNTPPSPNPFTAGRGSMPTGDRFQIDFQPMPQPPSVVAPGKGAVPVAPFTSSGLPDRIDVSIPDMAGIAKPK